MIIVMSVNGISVRLTSERWAHIVRRHPELDGQKDKLLVTLNAPDIVQKGDMGTLLSLKLFPETPLTRKFLVVVYKEVSADDGFVLTAYFTEKPSGKRRAVWKP